MNQTTQPAVPVVIHPMDTANTRLVQHAHPGDWINPEPAKRYNLVVLGAGTAGLVSAAISASLGGKVALVERHLMGGDCLNYGCVPSKAIIRSSRAAWDVREATHFGVQPSPGGKVDFPTVMERMRKLRSQISHHDSAQRFTGLGVDVFLGEGRFTSSNTLMVKGETLRFKKAIIATGARAVIPHIEGLEDQGYLTNESVFSLTERPDRLVVIGGGPIGCELAQAFQRLGSQVTLIESGSQFLAREDPDASGLLADVFEREGIEVRLGAQVLNVAAGPQGEKIVHVRQNEATLLIPADRILVGVGRAPNIEELNLDGIGVRHDQSGILVDEALRTTNPSIYAAGDVCSSFKFTHSADFTARIAVQNALFPFLPKKKMTQLIIPWCTYTDPEIAHVGAYPRQLDQEGTAYQTITVSMGDVDRAILEGDSEGFLKIHAATHDGRILGATLVSRHAGEMISEITLAMNNGIKLSAIGNVIHPYPTQAEVIRKSADAWNRQRLTPGRKKVLERILRWLR